MIKKRTTVGLITFLKGSTKPEDRMPGCANFDHYYGGCLFSDTCLVQEGKRCGYFEKCVLPTAEDIGLKALVYSLYRRHVAIEDDYLLDAGEIRRCPDCGAELKPRQRYCDKCRDERRRDSYRRRRQK